MSGPKRNPDRLNTIGIVVVGICGAVLVYVTIVALEAFYVNDTSEIQSIADYGGQDTASRSLRTDQLSRINEYGSNPKPAAPKANEAPKSQSYRVPVDVAMKLVVEGAKADPSVLIPAVGRSDKSTVLPIFGRPKLIPPPPAPVAPAPVAPAPVAPAPVAPASGPTPDKVTTGANAAGTATHAGSNARPKDTVPAAPADKKPAPRAGSAAGTPPKGNGK